MGSGCAMGLRIIHYSDSEYSSVFGSENDFRIHIHFNYSSVDMVMFHLTTGLRKTESGLNLLIWLYLLHLSISFLLYFTAHSHRKRVRKVWATQTLKCMFCEATILEGGKPLYPPAGVQNLLHLFEGLKKASWTCFCSHNPGLISPTHSLIRV